MWFKHHTMKYYLFLDESGDHGLDQIDEGFPVFVLSGVLFSHESYLSFKKEFDSLIKNFWNDKKVLLHSRELRRCEKEFSILLNLETKNKFYQQLNSLIRESDYTIISAGINKKAYINEYGRLASDPYEIALSFVIERTIFKLDSIMTDTDKNLEIIIEKRGKLEDKKLEAHFNKLIAHGTAYVKSSRLHYYKMRIHFRSKQDYIKGLQLSDLIAYPIARYILDQDRANPAFDILKSKIYSSSSGNYWYGLKIFPKK